MAIKWFKDKKEILSSSGCYVIKDNASTLLEIFFAKTSDSGDYSCETKNDVGSTSCQAALYVKGYKFSHRVNINFTFSVFPTDIYPLCFIMPIEPPKFIRSPERLSVVRPGQNKVFECQVTGTPEIDINWFRGSSEIVPSDRYKTSFINSVATLELSGAEVRDSGQFYCEARNEAGSESCSMELHVKGQFGRKVCT